MKYVHIEKAVMIPKTSRELYFEFSNGVGDQSFCLWFNPPFTYRGFELSIRLAWVSFGIRWNIPF